MEKISRRGMLTAVTGVLGGVALGCSQTKPAHKEVEAPTTVPITPEIINQAEEAKLAIGNSISLYANEIREIALKKGITPETTKLSDHSESYTYKWLDSEDNNGYELTIIAKPNEAPTHVIFTHLRAISEDNPSLREYQEYALSCSDQLVGFSVQDGGFIEDQMIPRNLRLIQIDSGEATYSVLHYPEPASDVPGDASVALADQTKEWIRLDEVFSHDLFASVTEQIDHAITQFEN